MFNVKEQRALPRIKVDCKIAYKAVNDVDLKEGIAKNISGNGVLFVADEQVEVGDIIEINIVPGEEESVPPMSAIIEVVRVNPTENGDFEIAGLIKTMK